MFNGAHVCQRSKDLVKLCGRMESDLRKIKLVHGFHLCQNLTCIREEICKELVVFTELLGERGRETKIYHIQLFVYFPKREESGDS